MVVVIMGVSGAGKSAVGRALADALGARFHDADDFHSAENVARMRAGVGLGDVERAPWLAALNAAIRGWLANGERAVLACSALKRRYRHRLREGTKGKQVTFVYLRIDPELARERLGARAGHFAHASLLPSQLADLEEPGPDEALTVDAALPLDAIVRLISASLAAMK